MNRSKLAAVAAIIFLVALSVLAQSTSIKVDGNIIKSYIATMSDAAHQGRRSLTPGYEKTAEWAAGLFKQWGLKPAGENGTYFQKVPILAEIPEADLRLQAGGSGTHDRRAYLPHPRQRLYHRSLLASGREGDR